jgi:hypothetical protein
MAVERSPGSQWLANYWDEMRKFNFEWVAATGDGPIAHDPLLENVIEQVAMRGLEREAVYALIDFDEPLDGDERELSPPPGLPWCEPPRSHSELWQLRDYQERPSAPDGLGW